VRRPIFVIFAAGTLLFATIACGRGAALTPDTQATIDAAIAATSTAQVALEDTVSATVQGTNAAAPTPIAQPPATELSDATSQPLFRTPRDQPTATPRTLARPTATGATATPWTILIPTATRGPAPTAAFPQSTATVSTTGLDDFEDSLEDQSPFSPPVPDGQPTGQMSSPFAHLFPEVARKPAPAWLEEGIRVTYYGQSANLAVTPGEESSGSAGYLQCDLVALDDEAAVSSVKFYLDLGQDMLIPTMILPSLGMPGAGDYWLHPDVLQDAERVANEDLVVIRGPAEIEGQTFQVVRFEYRTKEALYVWMFDENSGILVFYRHEIQTAGDTHRLMSDLTLVNVRQVELPWQNQGAPDWVDEIAYLEYTGAIALFALGSPAGSVSYDVAVEAQHHSPRWSVYRMTDYYDGKENTETWRVVGAAQVFDALWLPIGALDAVRNGQILDKDPVTGAQIEVSVRRDGSVVLTEAGRAYYTTLTYGSDGGLSFLEQEVENGTSTTVVELELTYWR
jgi:hypothetical protein